VLKESVLSEGQVYLHKSLIIEFVYLVPISVMNVFIAPYFRLISSFLSYFSNNNVFLFLLAIKLFLYVLHVFNIAYCRQWKLSLCFILYIVVLHDYQNKILFIFFKKHMLQCQYQALSSTHCIWELQITVSPTQRQTDAPVQSAHVSVSTEPTT